jgi:hypothetical protein
LKDLLRFLLAEVGKDFSQDGSQSADALVRIDIGQVLPCIDHGKGESFAETVLERDLIWIRMHDATASGEKVAAKKPKMREGNLANGGPGGKGEKGHQAWPY